MAATTRGKLKLRSKSTAAPTEIGKRSDDTRGFVVPPAAGVERTFSWFGRNRRLENLAEILAAFVTLAFIQLSLRRLASA